VEGRTLRVKLVDRPGGRTGKTETDDVMAVANQAERARLRREAERAAEAGLDVSDDI
jgi:pyridinium-3,5-bisthiocarboxylic acid mononucleotide nickel chelatase